MLLRSSRFLSFPFPDGEFEQASEQAGPRGSAPGVSKKWGEVEGGGDGGEREWGGPSIAVSFPSRAFLETPATQASDAGSQVR